MKQFVSSIVKSHNKKGGATFHPLTGDLLNTDNYAVSCHLDNEWIIKGKLVNTSIIKDYLECFVDIINSNNNVCIGTWYNESNNSTYIDCVTIVKDKFKALKLAKQHNQLAIFNLKTLQEIATVEPLKLSDIPF